MTKSKSELVWNNNNERQQLWIQVDSWQYKIFIESFNYHRVVFQFEGIITKGEGLTGLRFLGDIEVPTEIQCPDENEAFPDDHGMFYLVENDDATFVGGTLLVNPSTHAELFKLFSAAFASSNTGMGLELHLKHARGSESGFWRTDWQTENIQISHFGLGLGTSLLKQKD